MIGNCVALVARFCIGGHHETDTLNRGTRVVLQAVSCHVTTCGSLHVARDGGCLQVLVKKEAASFESAPVVSSLTPRENS